MNDLAWDEALEEILVNGGELGGVGYLLKAWNGCWHPPTTDDRTSERGTEDGGSK